MATKLLVVKEEGTHPPAEGVLARFAKIRSIRSLRDVKYLAEEHADVILLDLAMPNLSAGEILHPLREALQGPARATLRKPLIVFFDANVSPSQLIGQLTSLGTVGVRHRARGPMLAEVVRVLGVSQEILARMLNVSTRTAHRWLKGARPRAKSELDQLTRIVRLLQDTFPSQDAIRTYLNHPNPSLGGKKPISVLTRGEFDRVAADLRAFQEGVYV